MGFQNIDETKLDELLRTIAMGEVHHLEELYKLTNTTLFGFALSIVKNKSDAEDIVHDSYLSILRASKNYQSYGKPMAWMLRITRNLCMDKLREGDKRSDQEIQDWMIVENIKEDHKELLNICFQVLDEEERQIVTLHSLTGLKFREIAQLLEIPLSTTLSKYRRALKKMKKEISEKALYEK